jgi:hypothetical protein
MDALQLHLRDQKQREEGGRNQWTVPEIPDPITEEEVLARRIFDSRIALPEQALVHVYDVLELIELGVKAGYKLAIGRVSEDKSPNQMICGGTV